MSWADWVHESHPLLWLLQRHGGDGETVIQTPGGEIDEYVVHVLVVQYASMYVGAFNYGYIVSYVYNIREYEHAPDTREDVKPT